jgi:hypothetical protein
MIARQAAWNSLRAQWASSRGLRIGVWTIVAIVWVQALLLAGEQARAWQGRELVLRDDLARLQTATREQRWSQRADDARQQVTALRSLLWTESDRGLAEAATQDWVRSTASKAGLTLRDVALVRAPAAAAEAVSPSASAPAAQAIRMRVVADLNRLAVTGFLAELARNERAVLVDRLALRPAAQPAQAEMELRFPLAAAVSK